MYMSIIFDNKLAKVFICFFCYKTMIILLIKIFSYLLNNDFVKI